MTAAPIDHLLIGNSVAIRRVRALIQRVAPTSLPVLIQGPTGSGKELAAQALHLASGRVGRLVPFNVCAVADPMFEDALFGHVRGAFTGAFAGVPGYLLEADRGTVFLDEISGLPLPAQGKLLRAIETKEFRAVGAPSNARSDFRVLAASNLEIADQVVLGLFRADLAHRLAGVVIEMPPLSARPADVPVLAQHFASSVPCGSRSRPSLSGSCLRLLQSHEWPGNVRELRHAVEAAVLLSERPIIRAADVRPMLRSRTVEAVGPTGPGFPRARLLDILRRAHWNTRRAAEQLGMHRATLYRHMQRFGIRVPAAALLDEPGRLESRVSGAAE